MDFLSQSPILRRVVLIQKEGKQKRVEEAKLCVGQALHLLEIEPFRT